MLSYEISHTMRCGRKAKVYVQKENWQQAFMAGSQECEGPELH